MKDPSHIRQFLERYVTARLPDNEKEPLLHKLVVENQLHYEPCRPTCQREVKINNTTHQYCRFDFPRPKISRILVEEEWKDDYLRMHNCMKPNKR